ncbi:MAG TPA: MOSC N-terminal beta barrel domain-containing protein [Albitalea sp.]|uniref:MOSC domain-containing protein n=1 Tax=Piscinibacter sp. TaxID=1903157 RepID=UPI002ED08EA3
MVQVSDDLQVRVAALHLFPIKSCAGITLEEALLVETGLELDRAWMVVDTEGRFVTQREQPRMALIRPTLRHFDLVLRAPGMLALHLALDAVDQACRVQVWNDEVAAYDMGELAGQWFSDFLGQRVRLVRFDPEQRRLSSTRWTGDIEAENAFSDGYPILVASSAGLDELNRRLGASGHAPVDMLRFRPNLVLAGLEANGEDHLDEIRFDTPEGPIRLKLVKPCARCTIPDVDPATAAQGHAVGDTLASYRADARLDGAITFGMNAVIVEGIERMLRVGSTGSASYRFD